MMNEGWWMKDDEWRMMNEEWWWMNEEWWRMMIASCWGVLVTDVLTDIGECRVAFATEKSPTIIIINIGTVTNISGRGWILEIFSTSTFSYPNNSYSFTMCKAHACISLAITATHRCLWRLCRLDAGTTRGCLLKIFSTRLEKNALRDKTSNQQFLCFSVIVK